MVTLLLCTIAIEAQFNANISKMWFSLDAKGNICIMKLVDFGIDMSYLLMFQKLFAYSHAFSSQPIW